jgi:hypothetical protein
VSPRPVGPPNVRITESGLGVIAGMLAGLLMAVIVVLRFA